MSDEAPANVNDTASPQLLWAEDGSPRSGRFGDVYFSKDDGLAETRAVFLAGCGLPEAWNSRDHFTVAELGFGTGLNIAALLDLWRREGPTKGRLHVFSVEGFPLSRDEAARALAAWPELAEAAQALLDAWPESTPGFHRLDLPAFRATLDLAIGDIGWALDGWSGPADAWFLDGFAPSTNPAMWSDAVLDRIVALSAPGARVATFTVAGAVRRGLAERGFVVDKRPGHGRKRERLEARLPGSPVTGQRPSVAVIGAGVAGASLARAFTALGVQPVVFEAQGPGAGASGFPAALVTPRLDVGDAAVSALFAQAVGRAADLYRSVPGAVLAHGVLQLEHQDRDAGRFARIADQPIWPDAAMRVIDAEGASAVLGEAQDRGGLLMKPALAVHPRAILDAWLAGTSRRKKPVARLRRDDDQWTLLDPAGQTLAQVDAVVIAAGWGAAALQPDLPLSSVRGQAEWVEGPSFPAVAWGGYAVPTADGLLFGATHDRGETSAEVRADDSARNRAALAARLPERAARVALLPGHARAAIRAVTPDRLPLAGAGSDAPGLFVLGGLGSRGFCAAPLLAEHVAALAVGAPSPLPAALARRVDPARFVKAAPLAQPRAGADR